MKRRMCFGAAAALLLGLGTVPSAVFAKALAGPLGSVVLTVDGQIANTNEGGRAEFDMAMLESLPRHVVRTATPWEERMVTYEGVLLRDLLDAVGARGAVITVHALDDYHEEIAAADTQSIDVILAYKRDGAYMQIRRKGPLSIVFPFSDDPSLLNDQRKDQSVWQVNRIGIK